MSAKIEQMIAEAKANTERLRQMSPEDQQKAMEEMNAKAATAAEKMLDVFYEDAVNGGPAKVQSFLDAYGLTKKYREFVNRVENG